MKRVWWKQIIIELIILSLIIISIGYWHRNLLKLMYKIQKIY
jgi:hypothetical protein